ncbi:hypothetical protein MBLNU457_6926t1 [Dothideomycetes sp. NU457]
MQPTQPLMARVIRRLKLTTKMVNKGFYKGTGTGSMGTHTKWGGFKIDWDKVRTYKAPDLSEFYLTPFVFRGIPAKREATEGLQARNGKTFLKKWKNSKRQKGEPRMREGIRAAER